MINVNGNEITLAFGIIGAIIVVGTIVAKLIKDFQYKRKHRHEEKILNAETDNTSIELPARGFSVLRGFGRAGHGLASAEEQPINKSPSRASSILRSLSTMTRFRSRVITRPSDLESQITAYRSPSAAEIRDEIRSRASIPSEQRAPSSVYQSRSQQWTEIALDSPRNAIDSPHRDDSAGSPISVVSPIGPDFSIAGDIGNHQFSPGEELCRLNQFSNISRSGRSLRA